MVSFLETGNKRKPDRSRVQSIVLGFGWVGVIAVAVYIGTKARVVAGWGDGSHGYGSPDGFLGLMAILQSWAVIPMLLWIAIAFVICRSKAASLGAFSLGVILCDLLYVVGVFLWINTGLMAVSV
jgi:hypothetical protein